MKNVECNKVDEMMSDDDFIYEFEKKRHADFAIDPEGAITKEELLHRISIEQDTIYMASRAQAHWLKRLGEIAA